MEESLKKRIACIFGNRKVLALPQDRAKRSEELAEASVFWQHYLQYVCSRLGRCELHACPICYTWLERDMLKRSTNCETDPISVLLSLDEGVEAAATVVFTKKKDVVTHLKVYTAPSLRRLLVHFGFTSTDRDSSRYSDIFIPPGILIFSS
jgi:hypothetical protein